MNLELCPAVVVIGERVVKRAVRVILGTATVVFGGGRCALCGATAKDAVLQVDHIVPRSRGGSNEKSNLQVLCQRCNGGKNNKDQTDFRSWNVPSDSGLPDSQPSNLAEPDA